MSASIDSEDQRSTLAADNWIGHLPNHWMTARIKHGFRTIRSGTTPPSNQEDFYGGDIPWVNTSELRENTVTSTEKTVTSEALREFSALKIYPKNSLLFAMYGATIGRVAILGIDATVNQAVCVLADPSEFSERYVFYGLQASRAILGSVATGGGQPNLNAEKVREHKLPRPPIDDQTAIANYLDRETVHIDRLIAEKERMLTLLEEKRAALISRVVTRGLDPNAPLKPSGQEWLGEIPAHWPTTKFSWDVFISEGQVDPEDEKFSEMILVAPNHIESRTGLVTHTETSADQGAISGKYLCEQGDVLYSKIRPALRKVAVPAFQGACHQTTPGCSA